jgi:hypothetical protein
LFCLNKRNYGAEGVAHVVECLSSKCEAEFTTTPNKKELSHVVAELGYISQNPFSICF